MINELLEDALRTHSVTDEQGRSHKLQQEVSPLEGEFLRSLIQDNDFAHTIEIGCAHGISTLYICDALSDKQSPKHIIIDPYQSTHWHGNQQ